MSLAHVVGAGVNVPQFLWVGVPHTSHIEVKNTNQPRPQHWLKLLRKAGDKEKEEEEEEEEKEKEERKNEEEEEEREEEEREEGNVMVNILWMLIMNCSCTHALRQGISLRWRMAW